MAQQTAEMADALAARVPDLSAILQRVSDVADDAFPLHVQLESPVADFTFRQVVARAGHRLRDARCDEVLNDFRDRSGRTLAAALTVTGWTPTQFLLQLSWIDGGETESCRRNGNLVAFTTPGDRVIRVCGSRFADSSDSLQGQLGEMIVIHELLHALGLPENPPKSAQITTQVTRRCGDAETSSP